MTETRHRNSFEGSCTNFLMVDFGVSKRSPCVTVAFLVTVAGRSFCIWVARQVTGKRATADMASGQGDCSGSGSDTEQEFFA